MVLALLSITSITDILWRRIPNVLVLPVLIVALFMVPDPLIALAWGVGIGMALAGVWAYGCLGGGDVKLGAVLGVCLGPVAVAICGIALIFGGVSAILGGRDMPFAPFMLVAYYVVMEIA